MQSGSQQKKGEKIKKFLCFYFLETRMLSPKGCRLLMEASEEIRRKQTFDEMENFWRNPGPDPSGRSLDPDEIQPDQNPLHWKKKKFQINFEALH